MTARIFLRAILPLPILVIPMLLGSPKVRWTPVAQRVSRVLEAPNTHSRDSVASRALPEPLGGLLGPILRTPGPSIRTIPDWQVGLPAILVSIAWCESRDNPTAVNSSSGDGGLFQFDPGTWASFGGYGRAQWAPPTVQAAGALALYERDGTSPWTASEACWS